LFFVWFVWWLLLFVFVWFFWFDLALRRPHRTAYLVLHWHGDLGPSLHQDGWHNLPIALINKLHATACWPTWRKQRGDGRKKKGGQRVSTMRIYVFVWIDVAVLTSCPSSPATVLYIRHRWL
jgi:hypothetical protein